MQIVNLLGSGPLDYMDVDALQRRLHDDVAALRSPDSLIVWEADHTYTAGRRTQPEDIPDDGVPVIRMDRGGSVTYHGPGQLVIYPIIKVRPPKDVVAFVRHTELAVIDAMRAFGVDTIQVEGRSGVWIPAKNSPDGVDAKLCAIGIKFADDATMHGLALNVTTDIDRFNRVVPCGINDAGVVSLAQLGVTATLSDVAEVLIPRLVGAYAQFQLRTGEQLETGIDPNALLAEAHQQRATINLPMNTGVAWTKPATPVATDQIDEEKIK